MSQESDGSDGGDEEYVQLNVRVPKSAKERADERLPHGGLTREVRDRITELASGRSSEVTQLRDDLADLRDERRELAADLEQLDIDIERKERELLQLVDEQR